MQSFTARMSLLTATNAFGLEKNLGFCSMVLLAPSLHCLHRQRVQCIKYLWYKSHAKQKKILTALTQIWLHSVNADYIDNS